MPVAAVTGRSVVSFTTSGIGELVSVRGMRSRVTGARLAIGFGVSSFVVALIGPAVKDAGFPVLLAGVAFCSFLALSLLPSEKDVHPVPAPPLKPAE